MNENGIVISCSCIILKKLTLPEATFLLEAHQRQSSGSEQCLQLAQWVESFMVQLRISSISPGDE